MSGKENDNLRRLELMIMDDEGYTDEEVWKVLKATYTEDRPILGKVVEDLRVYRHLLWIKLERESPLFYQRDQEGAVAR